jgi:hypothetical protein
MRRYRTMTEAELARVRPPTNGNTLYVNAGRPMTAKMLIAALKKFPWDALVAWRDHDVSSEAQINDYVRACEDGNAELLFEEVMALTQYDSDSIVVLSGDGGRAAARARNACLNHCNRRKAAQ